MKHHRTIVVADHHKSVFVCEVLDRETGEASRRTLSSVRSELRPFLAGLERPALIYVEACRAWEWVSDLCEELGHDFRLVDPRRMPEIARSTKKSDERDVEAMVRRLQIEGDLPQSYRATREERERRALSRRLADVRKWRRQVLIKIHAVIDSQGLPAKKAQFIKAEWRETMKTSLSADSWLDLEVLLLQHDQLSALTDLLEQRIAERFADHEGYQRLQSIPGVGPTIAATIVAETSGIERFGSARQFAAFCGLVPRVRSSAGKAKHGHITRSGPRDLRWALGMAVMVGQFNKESSPQSRMYRRKKRKGKPARVALCAAANKLARIVYVILARGENYRGGVVVA
jgi:transposase